MDYALEVKNLSKTYKRSGFTLDNVSFRVPKGTIMGFVGENGAGKSICPGKRNEGPGYQAAPADRGGL